LGRGAPPGQPGGAPGQPGGAFANAADSDVEHLLLRFIDCDVQPGITYEYRIRVLMLNPNYGKPGVVSNPEYAKENYKTLKGPWRQLPDQITVPPEFHLYAYDAAEYRKKIDDAHRSNKALLSLLQAKESQAVVQVQNWMEQVRLGDRREPVGAWVVAEMPVGRGEYVGKKQYVKLPLWDSAHREYRLREVPEEAIRARPGQKKPEQPLGWLIDFSAPPRSVLVDFEGGKVRAPKPGGGTIDEDAAVEVLILRPDGKLTVRNSAADMADKERSERNQIWDTWVKTVEQRKPSGGGDQQQPGSSNPFGGGNK